MLSMFGFLRILCLLALLSVLQAFKTCAENQNNHAIGSLSTEKQSCKATGTASYPWLDPTYLCEAGPTERAPRLIEAQQHIGSGTIWKNGVIIQDIMRLTSDMQNCIAQYWSTRGVESVDWTRIRSEAAGSWWNSLLSLSLDHVTRSEMAEFLMDTLDAKGWSALHLATQFRLPWAIDRLCRMGANVNIAAR
jgi:hypothetical protein